MKKYFLHLICILPLLTLALLYLLPGSWAGFLLPLFIGHFLSLATPFMILLIYLATENSNKLLWFLLNAGVTGILYWTLFLTDFGGHFARALD